MGIFRSGMFKERQVARPAAAVPAPKPEEPIEDPHRRRDVEFEELKRATSAAFMAQLKRDGYVWPSDAPSMTLEEARERLREARGGSRFR